MHPLLIELEFEHQNLRKLLVCLEREIDQLDDAPKEALHHIVLLLEYLKLQPERAHHVNEECIRAELMGCGVEPQQSLYSIREDHGAFNSMIKRLGDLVRNHPKSRRLRDHLRAFVARYQEHMNLEEEHLFQAAEKLLDVKAWGRIEEAWIAYPDPVFGNKVQRRFLPLAIALRKL